MKPMLCFAATLLATMLTGCNSQGYEGMEPQPPYSCVFVMAITGPETRPALEDAVVERLRALGVQRPIASHTAFRDLMEADAANVRGYAHNNGVQAAVVLRTSASAAVVEETDAVVAWSASLDEVVAVEASVTDVVEDFVLEMVVWDTELEKPVWMGRSEVFTADEISSDGLTGFVATNAVSVDLR